jgi:hypothetical protein
MVIDNWKLSLPRHMSLPSAQVNDQTSVTWCYRVNFKAQVQLESVISEDIPWIETVAKSALLLRQSSRLRIS